MWSIVSFILAQNFYWRIFVWCKQLWSIWSRVGKSIG